jgi:hypothetical protein
MKKLFIVVVLIFSMIGCTSEESSNLDPTAESFEIHTKGLKGWHVKLDGTIIDTYTETDAIQYFKYVKGSKKFSEFEMKSTGWDEFISDIEKIEGKRFYLTYTEPGNTANMASKEIFDFTKAGVVVREFVNTKDNYSDIKHEIGSRDFVEFYY